MSKPIQKVLLVDDDQNIRFVAQMALEGLTDWKVILAASGSEAISVAKEERPDLILLDLMMPGMDGPSTYAKLKQEAEVSSTPVIFMTAKVQTHEVESHLKLGAAGVIAKPFDPMTLHEEILQILKAASA